MAENQGIKIRIRLKAYDHKVIDQSAKQIIDTAIRTGADVAGPIPLPTRRSTYTVVKSPHVYKMGGETYEMRVHKRLIEITNATLRLSIACKTLASQLVLTQKFECNLAKVSKNPPERRVFDYAQCIIYSVSFS